MWQTYFQFVYECVFAKQTRDKPIFKTCTLLVLLNMIATSQISKFECIVCVVQHTCNIHISDFCNFVTSRIATHPCSYCICFSCPAESWHTHKTTTCVLPSRIVANPFSKLASFVLLSRIVAHQFSKQFFVLSSIITAYPRSNACLFDCPT